MFEIQDNSLIFRFPEVHERATCSMSFRRTLRFPEKCRSFNLPPTMGDFRLHRVEDYADRLPRRWRDQGGVFIPMYQAEALWISFSSGDRAYPMAIKVAAGNLDALTAKPFRTTMTGSPQDYLVTPFQPWLDSFCVEEGATRQIVAGRFGAGPGAEGQLTGDPEHGSVQIIVRPMRGARYDMLGAEWFDIQDYAPTWYSGFVGEDGLIPERPMNHGEFLADMHGIDAWEPDTVSRCFLHLFSTAQYRTVAGCAPPQEPPNADLYRGCGLPWLEDYEERGERGGNA